MAVVTLSDLIQIGILVCGIISVVLKVSSIHNNNDKRK